jgi:hypothetical protein
MSQYTDENFKREDWELIQDAIVDQISYVFPVAPVLRAIPSTPVGPVIPVGPVFPVAPVLRAIPSFPVGPVLPCVFIVISGIYSIVFAHVYLFVKQVRYLELLILYLINKIK